MQERRKQPRKDLMSYSQVFELYHGKLIGYLGGINLLGAMVIGDEPYEVGTQLNISIQLPELSDITVTRMALPVNLPSPRPFTAYGITGTMMTTARTWVCSTAGPRPSSATSCLR